MTDRGWRASSSDRELHRPQHDRHDVAAERPARRPPAVARSRPRTRHLRRPERGVVIEGHGAWRIGSDAVLLLFDIDGTLLLEAADEHRDAIHAALAPRLPRRPTRRWRRSRPPGAPTRRSRARSCSSSRCPPTRIDERMHDFQRVAADGVRAALPARPLRPRRAGRARAARGAARPRRHRAVARHRQPRADRPHQARPRRARRVLRPRPGRLRLRPRGPHRAAGDRPRARRRRRRAPPTRGHRRHRRHAARHRLRPRRRRARVAMATGPYRPTSSATPTRSSVGARARRVL